MTRNAWESRDEGSVDLTVRCAGKRVMQILRGTPATVLAVRAAEHRSQELVLDARGLAITALGMAGSGDGLLAEFAWAEAHEIKCPNHKGGHFVDAGKLWSELSEARRRNRKANVDIRHVVRPYFDGHDPFG